MTDRLHRLFQTFWLCELQHLPSGKRLQLAIEAMVIYSGFTQL